VRKKFLVLIVAAALGFAVGCGGGSSSSPSSSSGSSGNSGGTGSTAANELPIAVDGGPTANQAGGAIIPNVAYASVTICVPGSTTNCVTVDHLLVDTGSFGVRVLQSAVSTLSLPTVNASNGSAAYDCVLFADGSFLWGPVQAATVTLAGETATNVPIQVVSGSTVNIPTSCSNNNLTEDQNAQSALGANGILGVGLEPYDCGLACDPSVGGTPPAPAYYTCSSSSCSPAFVALANQVTNPVIMFPTDNNGVIVELPAVSGTAATVTGSLIFGIGTESNNQYSSSATVFTLVCDAFTTDFEGQSYGITDTSDCSGPASFIDSGSNGLFFPNTVANIPVCPGNLSSFYCPPSLLNLSATNEGTPTSEGGTGTTKVTSFSVDNAQDLFTNDSTDAAFATLGGLNPTNFGFDWGLPFFYGVTVYSAIHGQTVPTGLPSPPWWAY
jgi:hypothetical protein